MGSVSSGVGATIALMQRHADEIARMRATVWNGVTDVIGYMFLDPERYARSPERYIKITDEQEVAMVRQAWVASWRDRECDIGPADGRVCVLGSFL